MLPQSKIDRINELARKKKATGLTPEETEEQKVLRQEFLADFRERFRAQLDNIEFVEDQPPAKAVEIPKLKN
ncbi:DUF896 domain-containing protein [Bacilliculturomica massiliensis]|uniref:DUF896 domain-containing protein n=1 Tax=Bacilliculturomica massiliensis TaxID=1917867 RepID=UPI0010318089|nr:DUF896 domain-containing protein [Bacilliculturomica massiliensis]